MNHIEMFLLICNDNGVILDDIISTDAHITITSRLLDSSHTIVFLGLITNV